MRTAILASGALAVLLAPSSTYAQGLGVGATTGGVGVAVSTATGAGVTAGTAGVGATTGVST